MFRPAVLALLFCLPVLVQAQFFGKKDDRQAVPFQVLSADRDFPGAWNNDIQAELEGLQTQGRRFYLRVYNQDFLNDFTARRATYSIPQGYMLFYFCVGRRNTGGYAVTLDKVEHADGYLYLHYHEGDGSDMATQQITYPALWVLLPASVVRYTPQLYQVPYEIMTDKKSGKREIRLDYKHADGIAYTEYLPATDLELPTDDGRR